MPLRKPILKSVVHSYSLGVFFITPNANLAYFGQVLVFVASPLRTAGPWAGVTSLADSSGEWGLSEGHAATPGV